MYRKGRYYYKSKRVGKRVITEYIGTGKVAQYLAEADAIAQVRREQEHLKIRDEREHERRIDRTIDTSGDLLRLLTQAILLVSGYHKHKGQWRKLR